MVSASDTEQQNHGVQFQIVDTTVDTRREANKSSKYQIASLDIIYFILYFQIQDYCIEWKEITILVTATLTSIYYMMVL